MTFRNLARFNPVLNKATVDAHSMIYAIRLYCICISVGSTLLVLTGWAMREPLNVEQVTDTDSTLFYYQVLHIARESADDAKVMNRDDFLKTERLYHYTNRCSALNILLSGTLKFSELKRMNDINESFRYIYAKDGIESNDVYKEFYKYKQISLTHDGKLMGFAIPSMWGHYAEKGNGVCLVFDKKKLLQSIPQECFKSDVLYRSDYNNSIVADPDLNSFFNEKKEDLFFTKTIDWEYEQEFRIVTNHSDSINCKNSLIAAILCFAEDVPNGNQILNSEIARAIKQIEPNISVLEFSYWFNEPQLQTNEDKWYPSLDNRNLIINDAIQNTI